MQILLAVVSMQVVENSPREVCALHIAADSNIAYRLGVIVEIIFASKTYSRKPTNCFHTRLLEKRL